MSCNSPNRVFYIGINEETGKRKILYTSRFVDFIYRSADTDHWQLASGCGDNAVALMKSKGYFVNTNFDDVPCGQCLGCRLDHAKEWSYRIMEEKKSYPDDTCWFITLTYDDDHLPERRMIPDKVDDQTGEIYLMKRSEFYTVSKREHQLFMKRLRKKFQKESGLKIKYFMSGEYGSISYRPHYHYIIFGLKLDDLELYKSNRFGDKLYTSRSIAECWPYGFNTVGNVSLESAGYIARYAIKKRKMTDYETYEKLGIDPEFICMSRRPGIGKEYCINNMESIYETDSIVLPGREKAILGKPPKYYDSLLERYNPDKHKEIKERRKLKAERKENFIQEYMPYFDKEKDLAIKERNLKNSTKLLNRRNVDG